MSFKCEDAWSDRRTSGLGLLHDVLELSEAVELPGQVLELGLARLEVQLQVQGSARLHRARCRKRLGSPVWGQRRVLGKRSVKKQRNDDVKKYDVVKAFHMMAHSYDTWAGSSIHFPSGVSLIMTLSHLHRCQISSPSPPPPR